MRSRAKHARHAKKTPNSVWAAKNAERKPKVDNVKTFTGRHGADRHSVYHNAGCRAGVESKGGAVV